MKADRYSTRATVLALLLSIGVFPLARFVFAKPPEPRKGAKRSAAAADVAKLKVIEASTKQLVEKAGRESIHESDFVNPKVTAGKVRWHSSYEAARKAAEKSGKPVLLFQMMGKLDDQFC